MLLIIMEMNKLLRYILNLLISLQLLILIVYDNSIHAKAILDESIDQQIIISSSRNNTITNVTRMYDDDLRRVPLGADSVLYLNLGYNHLTHLDNYTFIENRYKNVRKIYLFRNEITRIEVHAFKGLKFMETLDLSDNNLTSIKYNTFTTNTHLKELILVNNQLKFERQQTFILSHSLQTLILSNNRITDIYDMTFISLTNLKRLILTDNKELVRLSPLSFYNLKNLKYLSLTNTGVHTINMQMFIKLPRIINLQGTPFAHNFIPPLTQLTSDRIQELLALDTLYN